MQCTVQAEYSVRVQLLEIYNEQLRDLLDTSRSGKRLDIRNTERSGLNVPDAIQVRPSTHPAQNLSSSYDQTTMLPLLGLLASRLV